MSWRPDGWRNPFPELEGVSLFEAGADAILEALKNKGFWLPRKPIRVEGNYLVPSDEKEPGWWIFIPDDS